MNGNRLAVGVHDDLAAGEMVDAVEHVEQGGLARARLADDAQKLPRVDLCADAPQGGKLTRRGGIGFENLAKFDNGRNGMQSQCTPKIDPKYLSAQTSVRIARRKPAHRFKNLA